MFKSQIVKFKVENTNTGVVTMKRDDYRLVVLRREEDGTPIRPGELVPGQVIWVDPYTGMVRKESAK